MKMSARNGLNGMVVSVEKGEITASVKIKIDSPEVITAIISKEAVEDLEIKEGDELTAVIKSTEVMVIKD
ncbi:TOBE domain-containing protein [Methanobacterium aggregans]|uniref:TOBE domain-containing protein n=1 Tax=Methanobacterium aggregans TaxID=1615586 RepID=UPI001AE7A553|nr:TOBE domain-containing protein [Methanobacterium aggregans]MBP2046988.1 molybdopterin-binding protein [Methanobacterium aggregans]